MKGDSPPELYSDEIINKIKMVGENITLELLVRKGNIKGVEKFAELKGFDEAKKIEKTAEAGIYYAIREMWKQAEGGIDPEPICRYFNQDLYKNYFSKTANTELLEDLIDVLMAGTEAMMEAYAQITAIDVFCIDSISNAIRRNLNNERVKKKVEEFVKSGYSLVFCTHDIDKDLVNDYFPLIDKWRDLINPMTYSLADARNSSPSARSGVSLVSSKIV